VVVVRDAQLLVAEEVAQLTEWMSAPAPGTVLIVAVVGTKAHRLVKAASEVVEVNVGSRVSDRVAFVMSKMDEYGVVIDHGTAQKGGDASGRRRGACRRVGAYLAVDLRLGAAGVRATRALPRRRRRRARVGPDRRLDAGDATKAIEVARRMLDSRRRAGLQIVAMVQRHYLNMARLEGSAVRTKEEAAALLGINAFPAGKALQLAQRLGAERLTTAVHWIADADLALKGGVSFGGKDLDSDMDVTELTVIEILVARTRADCRTGPVDARGTSALELFRAVR